MSKLKSNPGRYMKMLASNNLFPNQVTVTGLPISKSAEPYGSHLLPVSGKNIQLWRQIKPSQIKTLNLVLNLKIS